MWLENLHDHHQGHAHPANRHHRRVAPHHRRSGNQSRTLPRPCFRSGLVPRFLAVWGFLGYALFAAGSLLELSGVAGAGLLAAIPSGLFEVTFGIWLIARGFRSTATAVRPSPAREHMS